jgi:hypothetical protein
MAAPSSFLVHFDLRAAGEKSVASAIRQQQPPTLISS